MPDPNPLFLRDETLNPSPKRPAVQMHEDRATAERVARELWTELLQARTEGRMAAELVGRVARSVRLHGRKATRAWLEGVIRGSRGKREPIGWIISVIRRDEPAPRERPLDAVEGPEARTVDRTAEARAQARQRRLDRITAELRAALGPEADEDLVAAWVEELRRQSVRMLDLGASVPEAEDRTLELARGVRPGQVPPGGAA